MTTRPSSPQVWKTAVPSPSSHAFTVSDSPGITGDEKRASMPLKRAGSLPHSGVQERPAGEAVGAQAVEDRPVEAAHGRERRVGVQRVAVARQPVDQRLVGAGLQLDGVVGVAVGRLVRVAGRTAVAAPAALAADVGRHAGVEQRLAGVDEGRLALGDDHRALALVVDAGDLAHGLELALDGDLPVERDALLAVDEHRRVERCRWRRSRRRAGRAPRRWSAAPAAPCRGCSRW